MSASTIPCCMPFTVWGHDLFKEAMKKLAHLLFTDFPSTASTASHLRYSCHNRGHYGATGNHRNNLWCKCFELTVCIPGNLLPTYSWRGTYIRRLQILGHQRDSSATSDEDWWNQHRVSKEGQSMDFNNWHLSQHFTCYCFQEGLFFSHITILVELPWFIPLQAY